MHRINPDIDDLAKQAADNYPLKTDTADWTKVNEKLYRNDELKGFNLSSSYGKSAILATLLLIPLTIAVTRYPDQPLHSLLKTAKMNKPVSVGNGKDNNSVNSSIDILSAQNVGSEENFIVALAKTEQKVDSRGDQAGLRDEELAVNEGNEVVKDSKGNKTSTKSNQTKVEDAVNEKTGEKDKDGIGDGKSKRFYLGAVIAPELTSVRLQPSRKSINAGIVMGYIINKKWRIEAGAVLAKKYYYTDGKYVAPHSIRQDNSKILAVYANSSITEIPFTVQYNVKSDADSRLFVSTGMVSYVIHKEHYNYTYFENGEEKQGLAFYNKASDSWLTNIELSLGIERLVKKTFEVRAEPYLRIPIHGMGRSDVPVTSIGVNFAIAKTIK